MAWMIVEAAHWGLALIPVLVMLAVFTWLDAFALMSTKELLLLLLLGGLGAVAAYPVSGRMLDTLPIGFSNYSRFIAPWIEEAIKGAIVIGLFRFNRIGYKLDAILSGFAIGAGFSVVENIFYLTFFPDYGSGTWLVRGLGTAVMHGTTAALFAAGAHELAERETQGEAGAFNFRPWWFVPGYLIAVLLHMLFNQFPEDPLRAMMGAVVIAPVSIIAIFHFGHAEAGRMLDRDYAAHGTMLAVMEAGGWPDNIGARKIAALVERLGADKGDLVRDYFRTFTWLLVEAEKAMIEESGGDAAFNKDRVGAAFDRLASLRRSMGRSAYAALKAVMPFSRNDQWEVEELRQRLVRR